MKENKITKYPKHIVSATSEGMTSAGHSADEATGIIPVNFHSIEFNQTDELNDCCENYRNFQSLDGVVTADMRHQMERTYGRNAVDAAEDKTASSKIIEEERNKAVNLDAAPLFTVISHGRTLIIDVDSDHAITCGKLLGEKGLTCTLLVIKKETRDVSFSMLDEFALLTASAATITGAFGVFSAKVTVREDQINLNAWFDREEMIFDLVLDLQSAPSYSGDRLPLGYFATRSDPVLFHEAMLELPEMRGRFTKPQFTTFLQNLCIHGRSSKDDCCRCLAVCPYGAIQSVERKISISHMLCQGCGGCALVCPAQAIRMVHPSWEEQLKLLRSRLDDRSAECEYSPTVMISETEHSVMGIDEKNNERNVYFQVEQIGYVGLEIILAALVYGAGRVIVVCGSQETPNIQKAVECQTKMAGAILDGLELPADRIRFAILPSENGNVPKAALQTIRPDSQNSISPVNPPAFFPQGDKRMFIRLATQHLYDQCAARQPSLPLPAGSPFGAVTVDSSACTLCMACAANCPSGALLTGGDVPRLEFLELRCHQCGLCQETCPEKAIKLRPRILCDLHAIATPMVVCEAEAFRCVECGVPFASQTMIDRMLAKLAGHWMYASDRQIRRLQMCRICRTRDAFISEDVKFWSQQ